MGKIKLLFLAANAASDRRLNAGKELREIDEQIRRGLNPEIFEIATAFALRVSDLQSVLLREKPHIVHFSGHGKEQEGIVLENDTGRPAPVSGAALASLFQVAGGSIRLVFLNACESRTTSEAFGNTVDYTIAMSRLISDRGAIVFATAFYRGLSHRLPVPDAFHLGINQLQIERIPETTVPELLVRPGALRDLSSPAPEDAPAHPPKREGHVVSVQVTGKGNTTNTNTR